MMLTDFKTRQCAVESVLENMAQLNNLARGVGKTTALAAAVRSIQGTLLVHNSEETIRVKQEHGVKALSFYGELRGSRGPYLVDTCAVSRMAAMALDHIHLLHAKRLEAENLVSNLQHALSVVREKGKYKVIKLSKGLSAKVSPEDFEKLSKFKWHASLESRGTKWYAIRREKGKKIRMHREIMGLGPDPGRTGPVVDHIDHDSLNNQRWNLELITQEENMKRSKGWKKKGEKYS